MIGRHIHRIFANTVPLFAAFVVLSAAASAQQPIPGSVAASNYPVALAINPSTHAVDVLNGDYSLQSISGATDASQGACPALSSLQDPEAPGQSGTPGLAPGAALAVDAAHNLIFVLGSASQSPNAGVLSLSAAPSACAPSPVAALPAGQNFASLMAVDSARQKLYVVNQHNGNATDTLDVLDTSATPYAVRSYALDTNVAYSGLAIDPASGYVFISEGQRNAGGNFSLYVFNPSHETMTQVVGPNGQGLPAVAIASFPNPNNPQFGELAIVGQTPPASGLSPIFVLDTSTLQANGGVFTLTSGVSVLPQQSSYTNVAAAAFDARSNLLYVLAYTANNGASSGVELLRYDPTNTSGLSEQALAALPGVSIASAYNPTLVFNSQTQTAFLLNLDETIPALDLFQIGAVAGAQNSVTRITGQMVGDSNFSPLNVAVDSANGKTYVLSSNFVPGASTSPAAADNRIFILDPPSPALIATSIALTAPASAVVGQAQPFTVSLTSSGAGTPTGNITLTGAIGNSAPIALGDVPANQAFGGAGAQVPVTFSSAGAYSVIASYPGDTTFAGSTSAASSVQVAAPALAPTTLSLAGPATATANTAFNVQVTLATSAIAPTGSVLLNAASSGANTATQVATVAAADAAATNGASVPVYLQNPGSYTLTASYAGDSNYQSSNSPALAITVSPAPLPSFTLAANPPTSSMSPAQMAASTPLAFTLTLTAQNGYDTPVAISTSGLPSTIGAVLTDMQGNPVQSAMPQASGAQYRLVLSWNAQSAVAGLAASVSSFMALCGSLLSILVTGLLFRGRRIAQRYFSVLLAGSVVGLGLWIGGCSGSGSQPTQTSAVTITATPRSGTGAPQAITVYIRYAQ